VKPRCEAHLLLLFFFFEFGGANLDRGFRIKPLFYIIKVRGVGPPPYFTGKNMLKIWLAESLNQYALQCDGYPVSCSSKRLGFSGNLSKQGNELNSASGRHAKLLSYAHMLPSQIKTPRIVVRYCKIKMSHGIVWV
jgi:hypothetical protein